MSAKPNMIDGAVILADGSLAPMGTVDANANDTRLPPDMVDAPVAVAMTNGSQISAARPT